MAPTITVDGDEIIDASIDGDAVEEITIDGDLAWAAAVGLDGLTVTRQDGSYTASSGEHVVSNGGTITLPSPVQDGVVMVTEVQTSPQLTGTVDGITDPYISGDESVVFVSDGSAWYSVDRNQISAIPDSAIGHWPIDEGTGSTVTDSIGSNDGTINGGTWVDDNTAVGGHTLSLASADNMQFSSYSHLTESSPWSFAITFEASDVSLDGDFVWQNYEGTYSIGVHIENSEAVGVIKDFGDGSGDATESIAVSANTKTRVVLTYDGIGNLTIYANDTAGSSGGSVYFQNDDSLVVGADTFESRGIAAEVDNPIVADEEWSASTVSDDYNNQPWS